jgi:hypothetical protein
VLTFEKPFIELGGAGANGEAVKIGVRLET